jgi:hypothetical protein
MAITQKDIIDQIPLVITARDFSLLLALKSLTSRGWGMDNALFKLLDSMTESHIETLGTTRNKAIIFDHEKLSYQLGNAQQQNGEYVYVSGKGEVLAKAG